MANKLAFSGKTKLLLNLILFQAMLTLGTGYYQYTGVNKLLFGNFFIEKFFFFVLVAAIILAFCSLYLVKEIVRLAAAEAEAKTQEVRLHERERHIQNLRFQQHDFMNHLQVIYGSIQMGHGDRAIQYIRQLAEELGQNTMVLNLGNSEVAALLGQKIRQAEEKGIKVIGQFHYCLENTAISTQHIIRILGNLLDNAIYALNSVDAKEKVLKIQIAEDSQSLTIEVYNNLPIIPPELHNKIFEPGFSTKGKQGSGLGLANVRDLVGKSGGSIELISEEALGTSFRVVLPLGTK